MIEGEGIWGLEFKVRKCGESICGGLGKGGVVGMNGGLWRWEGEDGGEFGEICEEGVLE